MMSWDFWGSLEKIFKAYGDDGYDQGSVGDDANDGDSFLSVLGTR